jgi:30S ribosomal protein S31
MGKGDKKTKRGKIILGSSGVRRPKDKKKVNAPKITENVIEEKSTEKKPAKKTKKLAEEPKVE